jgi:hypothetical protein
MSAFGNRSLTRGQVKNLTHKHSGDFGRVGNGTIVVLNLIWAYCQRDIAHIIYKIYKSSCARDESSSWSKYLPAYTVIPTKLPY